MVGVVGEQIKKGPKGRSRRREEGRPGIRDGEPGPKGRKQGIEGTSAGVFGTKARGRGSALQASLRPSRREGHTRV